VLGAVQVVPIYWGAAWASGANATLTTQLDAFFSFIVTSSYMALLAEYSTPSTTIQHGTRLPSVHVSATEPGTIVGGVRQVTDAQIQTALQGWIAAHTAPATTANTLYFIFLPPNVVSLAFSSQSCVSSGYCGYHSHIGGVYYALIPFVNCGGCVYPGNFIDTLTEVSSHEFAEAVTDPALNAWWDPTTGPGDEIGDICNRQTVRLGGYLVQTEWSNSQAACVFDAASPFSHWQELDNNPASVAIVADGGDLYQLHNTGKIWKYVGPPLTGWQQLDNNPATKQIVAAGGKLYQLHNTGKIWKYVGPPMTGWQELDNNPASVAIVAEGGNLYQLHNTGKIWKYVGPPMTGWQELDNNPATKQIVAAGGNLYQLHNTGKIWKYVGPPMTGWQQLDNNPASIAIVADGGNLFQLHNTGKIWKYVGPPMTGWQELDNNPATKQIAAAGGNLYQLHNTGKIWKYVGPPLTGWKQLDNNPASIAIVAGAGNLYQLHNTGKIWKYTGV